MSETDELLVGTVRAALAQSASLYFVQDGKARSFSVAYDAVDSLAATAKDARMKERAMTDYFEDASRRAEEWQERAERAERERDAVHVRLCEERGLVAELEAALYAAPQPEAVRNWHTGGYLAWYERTRRAALANPDPKEETDGR